MGATTSQPSDADLSWKTHLYQYNVQSTRRKVFATRGMHRSARHHVYLISVSKVGHKRTQTSSSPTISDTRAIPKKTVTGFTRDNQVGLVMYFRDGKWSQQMSLVRNSDLTVWETLCENLDSILEGRRLRSMNYDRSDYWICDTETSESEDADDTAPKVYECAVLHRPKGRPSYYLKAVDWHRAMGEVSHHTSHVLDTNKLT